MSLYQVNKIIEKLQSCSQEVQQSAIRNLLSKIQCGLVNTNDICDRNQHIGNILTKWIANQNINTNIVLIDQVIDFIKDISIVFLNQQFQHHLIRQNLKSDIQTICQLREKLIKQNVNNANIDVIIQNVMDGNSIQQINIDDQVSFHKGTNSLAVPETFQIILKPDVKLLEYVHFPFVKLTEQDEKFLFDISVQLKFGNQQTILFTIKEQIWRALKDFPIEVMRSRTEIIEELLNLSNSNKEDNIIYYSLLVLQKVITKITKRFEIQQQFNNFNINQEIYNKESRDYIIYSYPSLNPSPSAFRPELNQKTLKVIIDNIVQNILQNYNHFTGRRLNILYSIILLIEKIIQVNQDAAIDTLVLMINEITKLFDLNEGYLNQQQFVPLLYIGYKLITLLPMEFKFSHLSRFIQYLEEAMFTYIYSVDQIQFLFKLNCSNYLLNLDNQSNLLLPQKSAHEKVSRTLELLFSKHYHMQFLTSTTCQDLLSQLEEDRFILPLQLYQSQSIILKVILGRFQVISQLSVSIEKLSGLETQIISQTNTYAQQIESVSELINIMIYCTKNFNDFVSQVQVKESMIKQYVTDLLINLSKACQELFEKYKVEQNLKTKQSQELMISKFFDLFVVCVNQNIVNLSSVAVEIYQQSLVSTIKLSAFRYLITFVVVTELEQKENYYQLSQLLFDNKGTSGQFWENNLPMQGKVGALLNSLQSIILEGISYQRYSQKILYIKKTEDFIQSLDLLLALKQNDVQCSNDDKIFDDLKQLMSSTQFLVSGKTYVLNLITNYSQTRQYWLPLLSYVHQCFLENVGEEQIEYLNLYIQLLSVVKQQSEVGKYIVKYLSKYQFNIRVANFILKLLKFGLIEQQADLIKYLQQNMFQFYHQCNYENSNCLIKLLKLSKQFTFFCSLDPLDQQLLFSRLIQLTKSHLQIIRYLALNILSLNLPNLATEQIIRLEDQLLDDIYQSNESQYIYSQIITIILKLQPFKKLTRIITYTENRLKSDISTICKAGLLRLVHICVQHNKEEAISQIYNLQLDHLCSQYLTKFNNLDELFLAFHASQILNLLMRQSVSKALALLQSYNLIEIVIHSIYKLRKYLVGDQPNLISGMLISTSLLLQFSAHYHKDYFEFEYNRVRQIKQKWNILQVITQSLQNDNFSQEAKVIIATTLQCIYFIEAKQCINEDLIHSLISIFRNQLSLSDKTAEIEKNLLNIISILGATASVSDLSKCILCNTGVANQIITLVRGDVEKLIAKQCHKISATKQNNCQQQKIVCQQNESFADSTKLQQSQTMKTCVVFLKLLFKQIQQDGTSNLDNNPLLADIIGQSLNLLAKFLFLGFTTSSQVFFDYFIEVLMNLGGNQQLNQYVSQKLTEQKWHLVLELKKYLSKEQLTIIQTEIILKSLGILGQNQDIRQFYIRQKIIEDVQEKLIKCKILINLGWNDKRKWQPNSQFNQHIMTFMVSLSFYKDTQIKILSSPQFVAILQDILITSDVQQPLCQDILLIFSNSSLNSKLKKSIASNSQLSCIIMNIFAESNYGVEIKYKASQFLLNLFYKCTQAVNMFNREQVYECFEYSIKDTQRQIDKISLNESENMNLISKQEENNKKVRLLQHFSNNINQMLKILRIDW